MISLNHCRNCAVFIGHRNGSEPDAPVIDLGTGFLLWQQYTGIHLVTARHIARILNSDPFVIRAAHRNGPLMIEVDRAEWLYHNDDTVDVAVSPLANQDKRVREIALDSRIIQNDD